MDTLSRKKCTRFECPSLGENGTDSDSDEYRDDDGVIMLVIQAFKLV